MHELLGSNVGTPGVGVDLVEQTTEPRERPVYQSPKRAQQVIRRHKVIELRDRL